MARAITPQTYAAGRSRFQGGSRRARGQKTHRGSQSVEGVRNNIVIRLTEASRFSCGVGEWVAGDDGDEAVRMTDRH